MPADWQRVAALHRYGRIMLARRADARRMSARPSVLSVPMPWMCVVAWKPHQAQKDWGKVRTFIRNAKRAVPLQVAPAFWSVHARRVYVRTHT